MSSFLKRDLEPSRRFKAKLKSRQPSTLIHSSHPSPSLVEKLAHNGFDAVLIDAEHGSVGRDRVEEMSRAAALSGTAAIIRPEGSVPYLVTGYLACGVDGFMLPLIRSPEQAQALVDTFRFSAPLDHHDRVMILMIEHIEAVKSLPALLRIDGVDAFLVAADDLALSMGEPVSPSGPRPERVRQAVDGAVAAIVDGGGVCGMRVDYETVDDFMNKGVTLFYDHADHMMARGSRAFLSKIRNAHSARASLASA